MIRTDDLVALVVDDYAVTELWSGSNLEFVADGRQRKAPETDDNFHIFQHREFAGQERSAVSSFAGRRLIVGWRAPHRRRHPRVFERQAVGARNRLGLRSQTCFVHRPKQPISASVSRENSSRSIRAVCTRRQTQNQYLRARISEAGDRFAPICLGRIGGTLLHRDFLAPLHQAAALVTRVDLAGEFLEVSRRSHTPRLFVVPIV